MKLFTYTAKSFIRDFKDLMHCAICDDTGKNEIYFENQWGILTSIPVECSCMNNRRLLYKLKQIGLIEMVKSYRFDNYEKNSIWQQSIYDQANKFCEANENCFYIGGCTGAGKTHIGTAIVHDLVKQGYEASYYVWQDIVTRLNQTVNSDPNLYNSIISELSNIECLYIDDFLKIMPNDRTATIDKAFKIINARYNQSKGDKRHITIISSEKTFKELWLIDEAVAGRILEMAGKNFILNITGSDKNYRKKSAFKTK